MKPSRCNNELKWNAREISIFEPARHLNLQGDYITLCNVQDDSDWYEYKQAKHVGKFIGVDTQKSIINDNKHLPGLWIHGSLYSVLVKHHKEFSPAVIYFDTISMVDKAIPEAKRIMRFLEHNGYENLIFVINIVSRNLYNGRKDDVECLYDKLWFDDRWQLIKLIEYGCMTTFTFYR